MGIVFLPPGIGLELCRRQIHKIVFGHTRLPFCPEMLHRKLIQGNELYTQLRTHFFYSLRVAAVHMLKLTFLPWVVTGHRCEQDGKRPLLTGLLNEQTEKRFITLRIHITFRLVFRGVIMAELYHDNITFPKVSIYGRPPSFLKERTRTTPPFGAVVDNHFICPAQQMPHMPEAVADKEWLK